MQDSAPESLDLLAPDGIVRVMFAKPPDGDQCIALLNATENARSADELVQTLQELGESWGIKTEAEVTSRAKQVTVLEPEGGSAE